LTLLCKCDAPSCYDNPLRSPTTIYKPNGNGGVSGALGFVFTPPDARTALARRRDRRLPALLSIREMASYESRRGRRHARQISPNLDLVLIEKSVATNLAATFFLPPPELPRHPLICTIYVIAVWRPA